MAKVPMTVEGATRLKAELQRLKTVDRPGDHPGDRRGALARRHLRERRLRRGEGAAGLHRGPHRDGRGEARQRAGDRSASLDAGGRVVFGATVELADADTDERAVYQIVGDDEADIKHGKISVSSPIARALIGKTEGDTAEVVAPGGTRALRNPRGALRVAFADRRFVSAARGPLAGVRCSGASARGPRSTPKRIGVIARIDRRHRAIRLALARLLPYLSLCDAVSIA